jgi:hypothetical protein
MKIGEDDGQIESIMAFLFMDHHGLFWHEGHYSKRSMLGGREALSQQ